MTRISNEVGPARSAVLHGAVETELPDRLSWPAAAAVISVVSLSLWGLIGLGLAWLFS